VSSRFLHCRDQGASIDELELQTEKKMEAASRSRPGGDGVGVGLGAGKALLGVQVGEQRMWLHVLVVVCLPVACSCCDGLPPLLACAVAPSSFRSPSICVMTVCGSLTERDIG
jgi:hypothetical protein